LSKIPNQGIEKLKEPESNGGTITCKRKNKKLEFFDSESNSSSDKNVKLHKEKDIDSSENCDNKPKKKKYKPYEEISGEFRKIKPPMFNGEIQKGEEEEAWLSGMKKYFQIYNYFDRLKAKMAINNLTRKVDI